MYSIFIVDDHDIVRFALQTLFSGIAELQVVGTAADVPEAVASITELSPDLVITDMTLRSSRGLDTVRAMLDAQEGRAVLVLSMHDQMLYAEQVLAMGARGYLMKDAAHAQIVPAVQALRQGRSWVSPEVASHVATQWTGRKRSTAPRVPVPAHARVGAPLTLRELEVLERMGRGLTTKEIAFELDLSPRTIDIHRASLKHKLGLRSGAELMAYAASNA